MNLCEHDALIGAAAAVDLLEPDAEYMDMEDLSLLEKARLPLFFNYWEKNL